MVERLKLYIEKRGLMPSQFADAVGMPRSSFSQLLTGRNKSINDITIGKIHAAFPDLSITWLLFGEGDMLVDGADSMVVRKGKDRQSQLFFADENEIFVSDDENVTKYEQEIEVGTILSHDEEIDYNDEAPLPDSTMVDMYRQVITPAKHMRKVVKIMVFYDDNTFATFIPE